jgi:hypothetical protein
MNRRKIPSDEDAVRMVEEIVGAPRKKIVSVIAARQFTCAGCGRVVVSDGTPRTRAFVWTDVETGKRRKYCWDCDDKHIQGV